MLLQNLLAVKVNNLFGLEDNNGKQVLPALYEDLLPLYQNPDLFLGVENLIAVKKNGLWGVYNLLEQREIIACKFTAVHDAGDFINCQLEDKNILFTHKGEELFANLILLDEEKYLTELNAENKLLIDNLELVQAKSLLIKMLDTLTQEKLVQENHRREIYENINKNLIGCKEQLV